MTLKPYHKHALLHDYSEHRELLRQPYLYHPEWHCPTCNCAIKGPPWEIGDYIVTSTYRYRVGRLWRVYTRAMWELRQDGNFHPRDGEYVFESSRKRNALKHARELDRGCKRLLRALKTGDKKLLADIHRNVKRVEREERDA